MLKEQTNSALALGKLVREFEMGEKKVKIYDGLGSHQMEAGRMAAGNPVMHQACLMSLLVTINDERLVPEDFADLPLREFIKIQSEFAEVNFM